MVKCRNCGVEVSDSFDLCPNCGSNLKVSSQNNNETHFGVLICSGCGNEVHGGVNFCPDCGEKMEQIEDINKCNKCGSKVPENVLFCPVCGEKAEKITKIYSNLMKIDKNNYVTYYNDEIGNEAISEIKL